jgi:hypothetical protein
MAGVHLQLEPEALRPLIQAVVDEVVARLESCRQTLPEGRLCYSEAEAAELLSLEPHVLRDERLRKRIQASQIVGKRIRYMQSDLIAYLLGRRWQPKNGRAAGPPE